MPFREHRDELAVALAHETQGDALGRVLLARCRVVPELSTVGTHVPVKLGSKSKHNSNSISIRPEFDLNSTEFDLNSSGIARVR